MTAVSDILKRIDLKTGDDAADLLREVLRRCTDCGSDAIAVFDLDSTVLNNHARQVLIMREFADAHGIDELRAIGVEHWDGWDYRKAMVNAGLNPQRADELAAAYREFWHVRFFTSEYCAVDQPIAGAPAFTHKVVDTGARLFYVTGRNEGMRTGTLESFERGKLPTPDGSRVQLLMKPTADEDDDDYKVRTHRQLAEAGTVVAAFDNEPTHINDYYRAFPDALAIHLATDHSLRPILVAEGIPSIADFAAH